MRELDTLDWIRRGWNQGLIVWKAWSGSGVITTSKYELPLLYASSGPKENKSVQLVEEMFVAYQDLYIYIQDSKPHEIL